jgi:hypothetical protein
VISREYTCASAHFLQVEDSEPIDSVLLDDWFQLSVKVVLHSSMIGGLCPVVFVYISVDLVTIESIVLCRERFSRFKSLTNSRALLCDHDTMRKQRSSILRLAAIVLLDSR